MVSLKSWAESDIGQKRVSNEDALFMDDTLGLFMVADGMGGHRGGDRASRLSIDVASKTIREELKRGAKARHAIRRAFREAAREVCLAGRREPTLRGMGTTLSALLIESNTAHVAHIGDSRIYCLREGELRQLTSDHSLVNERVQAGIMTEQEARVSSLRNIITRAIGHDVDVKPDLLEIPIAPSDRLLLCTDGLTNMLSDEEIGQIVDELIAKDAVSRLIDGANAKGGDDNVSVILVHVTP